MKIGVTGAGGRLGSELVRRGCYSLACDVTLPHEIDESLYYIKPDIIINCAAVTGVDACEGSSFRQSSLVNSMGAYNIRNHFDGLMIQISTDYIFDGKKGPYAENGTTPRPINRYGHTKWYGEELIKELKKETCIVRTTMLYGAGGKPDFVSTIRYYKLDAEKPFDVTTSLRGSPTYIPHLVDALLKLCKMGDIPDIINVVGADVLSRYDFAVMIANVFEKDVELVRPTKYVSGNAQRPRKAGLKTKKASKIGLPIYNALDGLLELKS